MINKIASSIKGLFSKKRSEKANKREKKDSVIITKFGEKMIVYFPQKMVKRVALKQTLQPRVFRLENLELFTNEITGDYAMWWSLNDHFIGSAIHQSIARAYESLNGVEPYIAALLLKSLGFSGEISECMELPEQKDLFVKLNKGPVFVLSFSKEKGIRLRFNVKETPREYAEMVWRLFADFAGKQKKILLRKKVKLHEYNCLRWFKALEAYLKQKEAEGMKGHQVGVLRMN